MRNIKASKITETVARLCMEANYYLPDDVVKALKKALKNEESPLGKQTLRFILDNAELARQEKMPVCQDCGTAVIYLEIGQDVHIAGGDLYEAVNEGVRQGYVQGYLRKSIAVNPYSARANTRDNTPAVIHTEIVPGDKLKITVQPKGGGSENMSRLFMLTPADGKAGVIDAVVRLLPGSLGDHESAAGDSHYEGLLAPPSYTRPAEYRGHAVPEVLLSGDHGRIAMWRQAEAERLTRERRPDLWARYLERMGD